MKTIINKGSEKTIALILAAAMILGSMLWIAEAGSSAAESNAEETTETQEAIEKEFPDLLTSNSKDGEISKDEVIYAVLDADGNILDTSVTEWLHNGTGAESINDVSVLSDIENTANDKTFIRDGDNIVWKAEGTDIRYKGTTNKELPAEVKVTYYLDGKSISAEDIAGKAGNVTIRFDYVVKSEVTSGGYAFKTPYTMASGVVLDDEHFTNVRVSEGKVIDTGDKCICLGLAFPGMSDNLNIHSTEFNIPETVMVSAYTDCFEIDGTYTAAISGLLSGIELDGGGTIESKIEQLQNGMEKLGDASNRLVEGAEQLSDGAYELASGASRISDGAASIAAGAEELSNGLDQISNNSGELNDGSRQVFNTLLSTAQTQLKASGLDAGDLTIGNYKTKLGQVIDSLDKDKIYAQALEQVTAEVEKNRSAVEEAVTENVKSIVTDQVTAAVRRQVEESVRAATESQVREGVISSVTGLSAEAYDAAVEAGEIDASIQDAVRKAVETRMASDEIRNAIASAVETQMDSDDIKQTIASTIDSQMASDTVKQQISKATDAKIQELINEGMESEEVQKKLAEAEEGAKAVIALKTSLDKYNAFYQGVLAYTSAVDKASEGANVLARGASELKSGSAQLASGASDLYDGASKLYDGMDAFDRDGIDSLLSSLDESGVEELFDRFSALADASGRNTLIGGIAENMEGESRIIIKTGKVTANN